MANKVVTELHERIAACLGPKWSVKDCQSFNLAMLRELVREKDERLWRDIGDITAQGLHLFDDPVERNYRIWRRL